MSRFQLAPAGDNGSRETVTAAVVGVGAAVFGLGLLFTVGAPMGWPLRWWFNAGFIAMGAVFLGIGVKSSLEGRRGSGSVMDGLVFAVVGVAILLGAVFMGKLFGTPGQAPFGHNQWQGKPKAVQACQSAPFHACLAEGKFMGRFEGIYFAAVEPGGAISDVQLQTKLPEAARTCLAARVRALSLPPHGGERMAVMCQFIGSSMPSQFSIRVNPGYRTLAPGEPLVRPRPQPAGAASAPASGPRTLPGEGAKAGPRTLRGEGAKAGPRTLRGEGAKAGPRTLRGEGAKAGPRTAGVEAPHVKARTAPVSDPNVDVAYHDVLATPGCHFWSGPGDLGRQVALGTTGILTRGTDRATLLVGEAVVFTGRVKGKTLSLQRASRYDEGRWKVTETLDLKPARGKAQANAKANAFAGRYTYSECDSTGKQGCPGRCRIQAEVRVTPRGDGTASPR